MTRIQIYDKPMCCSTGICGVDVDEELVRFAADLEWLQSQGYAVERFNLSQQPQAFIDHEAIHHLLSTVGTNALPAIVIRDQVVSQSVYPHRQQWSQWLGKPTAAAMLPISNQSTGCCGDSGCC